jgi:hypothetical protein
MEKIPAVGGGFWLSFRLLYIESYPSEASQAAFLITPRRWSMRYPLLYPTPDETQATTLVVDRRNGERHFLSNFRPIRMLPRPSFQSFYGFLRDFSIQGFGLVFTRPLETGTILAIQLRKRLAGVSDILTAEVRHATPLGDGFWVLGCQLSRPLTEEECLALLHEDSAESPA